MRTHRYKRKNRKDDATYTFYELENAVRVVRKDNEGEFEHIFKKGDVVNGRTLDIFDFDGALANGHSVYATSEEYNNSNAQSLANQIDFIYNFNKDISLKMKTKNFKFSLMKLT